MIVAPCFLTDDRFRVIEYSSHLDFSHMKFIIKLPEPKTAWNSLILPFSFQIWIAIAVTLLVFGISLHKIMEKDNDLSGTNSHWPRRKIFWFLFGTLTFQGENLNSIRRFPSRLLIAIWWMSIFILVSSYTGTLMSFMTCPIVEPVPSTFDELAFAVASGEYSCGTMKGHSDAAIMVNSNYSSAKLLGRHIINYNTFVDSNDPFEQLHKGRFALISGHGFLNMLIKKDQSSKYIFSKNDLMTFTLAYGLRKGFPYKNDINKIVSRLFEAGITSKDKHSLAVGIQMSEFTPLKLDDIFSPLALLCLGKKKFAWVISLAHVDTSHNCRNDRIYDKYEKRRSRPS
ncbi:ionotropic receptor 21a-like [Centruroides vittatus]|uniref:ionotropic receptor 21a-like n=1 Tax=Centruroides vittatus TaxID=120091 RepID=UPI00350F461E